MKIEFLYYIYLLIACLLDLHPNLYKISLLHIFKIL